MGYRHFSSIKEVIFFPKSVARVYGSIYSSLRSYIFSSIPLAKCSRFQLSSCIRLKKNIHGWYLVLFGLGCSSWGLLFSPLISTATQKPTALKREQLGQWQVMVLACVCVCVCAFLDWVGVFLGEEMVLTLVCVCVFVCNGVQFYLPWRGDPGLRVLAQLKGLSQGRDLPPPHSPLPRLISLPWAEGDRAFVPGSRIQREIHIPKHLQSVWSATHRSGDQTFSKIRNMIRPALLRNWSHVACKDEEKEEERNSWIF